MIKLKKGDKTTINCKLNNKPYYYTGILDCMTFDGVPCVFLATDINNKLTYGRFTQQFLVEHGYII